jgi:hypothetical protein
MGYGNPELAARKFRCVQVEIIEAGQEPIGRIDGLTGDLKHMSIVTWLGTPPSVGDLIYAAPVPPDGMVVAPDYK